MLSGDSMVLGGTPTGAANSTIPQTLESSRVRRESVPGIQVFLALVRKHFRDISLREYLAMADPLNPSGHVTLGFGYRAVSLLEGAISSFGTAIRLSPDTAHCGLGPGWVYLATPTFPGQAEYCPPDVAEGPNAGL